MSETERWLATRRPRAPEGLAARTREALRHDGGAGRAVGEDLADAARLCLDESRARPGRVRESAFQLLLADALLTYACEAALEAEAPDAVLLSLAEVAARP